MESMFDLLLVLVGAAAGAGAGSWFALQRLQKETAFDRQLRWCEEAMTALNQAGMALVAAREAEGEASEKCWNETIQRYQDLLPLCGQKELYATVDGIRGINKFMGSLYDLIEHHLDEKEGRTRRESCDACLRELQEAGLCLAREARKHLGLEELPDELLKRDTRFFGSLAGRLDLDHAASARDTSAGAASAG